MSFNETKRNLNSNNEIKFKDKNDDYLKNSKREIDGKIFEIKNKNLTFNEKVRIYTLLILVTPHYVLNLKLILINIKDWL